MSTVVSCMWCIRDRWSHGFYGKGYLETLPWLQRRWNNKRGTDTSSLGWYGKRQVLREMRGPVFTCIGRVIFESLLWSLSLLSSCPTTIVTVLIFLFIPAGVVPGGRASWIAPGERYPLECCMWTIRKCSWFTHLANQQCLLVVSC